ncbi:hypothetical protein GCM10018952_58980 [Streptosporangium vulgare]
MSNEALREEQEYVSLLYGRLDELREHVTGRLTRVLATSGGNAQARVERDAAHAAYAERLARLDAAEHGLCFGRLDMLDGERRHIGRMGMLAADDTGTDTGDAGDTAPLLIDWRAPAARPFYLATAVTPEGVRLRRHIKDRDRTVTEIHDELLDLGSAAGARHEGLAGEAALLAALNAGRTGRMTDIVQTIQAEQDRVIRSEHTGVLVVQGGPGTGKTAVALHRAAYLLYTRRRQLARRVVLVIGPNAAFLRYIGNVLPALGETSVLLSTVGGLYPGVTAERRETPGTTEVKGRSAMAEVVAAAVRDREWVPEDHLEVEYEGETLRLDRRTCERARDLARGSLSPHNPARPIVVGEISRALAERYAERVGTDPYDGERLLDDDQVESIRREMLTDEAVRAALDELWPDLTPQRLLTDLFGSRDRIASAAPGFTPEDRALLLRGARRRLVARRRAPAGRGGRTARRGHPGEAVAGGVRTARAGLLRPGSAGRRDGFAGHRPGGRPGGRDPHGQRPGRRGHARRAAPGDGSPHLGRARGGRPDLGVRTRDRRRGAGVVGDGLAAADAAMPCQVDDRRRRHGAGRRSGGHPVVGTGARPLCRGALAA